MLPRDGFETTSELLEFVSLIDLMCAPLDSIVATKPAEPEAISTRNNSVEVPEVRLSRQALNSICELMLSEGCTKNAFKHIVSILTRLSKVDSNRGIVAQLIHEVILQLVSQSEERLAGLVRVLREVETKQIPEKRINVLSSVSLSEVGVRQHECLLQALQVLVALSDMAASAPSIDSIATLWDTLDKVLLLLQAYTESDDEDSMTVRSRPKSALSTLLSRLLPIVEAFFLLHSHDLLREKEEHKSESKEEDAIAPRLYRMQSMDRPGSSVRRTSEFNRLNIAVPFDTSEDKVFSRTLSMSAANLPQGSKAQKLLAFAQAHSSILNVLIQSNPSLLEGSFSAMVRVVALRSYLVFYNKRVYFFSQLQKRTGGTRGRRGIHIQVRRDQVFEDSFHQLRDRSKEDLRGRLQVSFHGEEGVDAGGLTREWYLTLSREIFNPNYALFSPVDAATFQPNPLSVINSNHLDYFKFVGRIIGKAIADGHLMDAHFTRYAYAVSKNTS
jgi:hypothetical protein